MDYDKEMRLRTEEELELNAPTDWKAYLRRGIKFLAIFYLITFCAGVYFTHQGSDWLVTSIFLIALYLFVFIVSVRSLFKSLPLPAIFLASPTIPLFMLLSILSLLPVLEYLK